MTAPNHARLTLRRVPAMQGWAWVRGGLSLLLANPAPIHLGLMFLFAALLLSAALPLLGVILPALLMPVLYVGLMNVIEATQAVQTNQTLDPNLARQQKLRAFTAMITVFQDFDRVRRLMLLGAAYALAVLAMMGLSALFDDGFMFRHLLLGEALPKTDEAKAQLLNGLLFVLPLYAPVSLIFWFAPQLVGLHGQGILKALFFSGLGCWRNLRAFAVYAVTWVLVFMLMNVLLFFVVGLLGSALGLGVAMVASVFLVTWLYCSFYVSYLSLVQVTPAQDSDSNPDSNSNLT